jgi:hypothetical protein
MEEQRKMTAAACVRQSCAGCEIEGKLLCVHRLADLVDFFALFVGWGIPFFAGMSIGRFWVGLAVWFGRALFWLR